ncbi:MAG: hypothetical protein KAT34_02235 [Candidatus Aminicenantes bacterium]|nr:hypothetical protein [Candidatus Aminicenantes bacterium]
MVEIMETGTKKPIMPAHIYSASLLVSDNVTCIPGEIIKEEESNVLLRHSLYSYSLYSSRGGWLLISPELTVLKNIIAKSVEANQILGAASIDEQWVIQAGRSGEAAAALSGIITTQVPGYEALPAIRKDEVKQDIEQLCHTYIEREGKFKEYTIDAIPIDRRPFDCDQIDSTEAKSQHREISRQVKRNNHIQEHFLELLSYYWESIFMIWWKGFW